MPPAMVGQKSEPFYVTLDATGNGSVQFTARKPAIVTQVGKVTVEMGVTASGVVALSKNGGFLSSMPVAPRMQASGDQPLYCSEYLTVAISNGPADTEVKIVFYFVEVPE